jgi:DMSO reductase family type II enzyme chaperone
MPTPQADAGAIERAVSRSVVYRFFSVALRPPDEALAAMTGAQWEAVLEAARAVRAGVAPALEAAREVCQRGHAGALSEEHLRTFGHVVGTTCPLYEAQYIPGGVFPQAQTLADLTGFYRAFGLEVDEGARERPDHLSLELEFMHVLAYREAYARVHHGPAEVTLLVDAQRTFIRSHLGRWGPSCARLLARAAGEAYGSLATALAAWLSAEVEALGDGPIPQVDLASAPDGGTPQASPPPCGTAGCPLELGV